MPDLEYCTICGIKVPARLVSYDIGPRAGVAAYCSACRPEKTPEGLARRAEVVALRRDRLHGVKS